MKAKSIFTCWAQLPTGALEKVTVVACDAEEARQAAFIAYPNAQFMSCRPVDAPNEAQERLRRLAECGERRS